MNFKETLEKACKKFPTQREFSKAIGQQETAVIDAKKGKRGLPDASCVRIAQILGIDFGIVIAARNEWTAKTEEEREFWHPLANAAGFAGICAAFVTLFVTPSPAQAAPILDFVVSTLCIMSNAKNKILKIIRKKTQLPLIID